MWKKLIRWFKWEGLPPQLHGVDSIENWLDEEKLIFKKIYALSGSRMYWEKKPGSFYAEEDSNKLLAILKRRCPQAVVKYPWQWTGGKSFDGAIGIFRDGRK